jgi:outer membrane protein OmpA-like peptidoglycan-associated protein
MTQDELREAVLAALLDYETLRKTRRLKAVKKALRGTVMATMLGSVGITAAEDVRSSKSQETVMTTAASLNALSAMANPPQEASGKIIPGVALFAFDSHTLAADQQERLNALIEQLPKDSEITVIGLTDSSGGQRYNKKLGRQRARAVADYLAQHGMKIKTIGNNISTTMPSSWMARRVDIVVDSGSQPFYLKLTSLEKQYDNRQSKIQPESKTAINTADFYNDKDKQELQEAEKKAESDNTKSSGLKSDADTVNSKLKPEQKPFQRQQIRGATHFAFNRHTLVKSHKERLMELIKQLPSDATLTVIGRTDADEHNKNLGMQRAKAVAMFLANHGVTVKAVASKVSSNRFTGWGARRVDIVVDSNLNVPQTIPQPPPVIKHYSQPITMKDRPEPQVRSISAFNGKKAAVIEQDVTHLIQGARNRFNLQ